FRTGIETGDLSFACYACHHLIADLLFKGSHLDEVWRESEKCLEFNREARFPDAADIIVSQQRFIQCMRGYTAAFSSFSDAEFDEERFEARLTDDRMNSMICYYWILKLEACFMFGEYEAANAAARKAEALLWSAADVQIQGVNYYYYHALTIAALRDRSGADNQTGSVNLLSRSLERFTELAANCPNSFLDKQKLLSAELARIEGRDMDAMRLYEEAIRAARQNGLVQNEAIANERAGIFYAARGVETSAHSYLQKARQCYIHWGANGKVRQLEKRYPFLREDLTVPTGMIGTPVQQLDVAAVIKASRAIADEIVLEKLVNKLMRIALEEAGAERGLLILPYDEDFRIEAEARTGPDMIDVYLQQTPIDPAELPESIFRYVIRTHQSVILDDATAQLRPRDSNDRQRRERAGTHGNAGEDIFSGVGLVQRSPSPPDEVGNLFSNDEYLRQRYPRSVLCLPLAKQSKLIGILYLENKLAAGVFTAKRLAMVEMLASQAAISLDHARLYSELSRANATLEREVNERLRAEAAVRRSEAYLAEAESLSKTGSWAFKPATKEITYWSHERYHLFGFDPEAGIPTFEALLQRIHPEDRTRWLEKTEEAERRDCGLEFRVVLPDGEIKHLYGVGHPVFSESGDLVEVIGAGIDITERKRAERELHQKEVSLREAQSSLAHVSRLTTIGELAVSIAHEVNQPLTAIINNANACLGLLPSETTDPDELHAALSDIVGDADRASGVIARIRALVENVPPQKSRLNINETIGEVIALTRSELYRHGVLLQTRLANDLPPIMGDRIQLQQVILNLIINAIEAMSGVTEGPRELLVSSEKMTAVPAPADAGEEARFEPDTSVYPEGSAEELAKEERQTPNAERQTPNAFVLVSVADSGPGLDANALNHLFDAFYTTKPQGLGMGLSISRSIVKAHGGRLWAMTNVPKGALLQFTLPIGAE
ncbi:MAG: PAS domain-containing protein, partial [Verrucomicrobia bacterium]|nr:PAS domain-containing protein [Verrucomicrobiota bacterium]